MLNPLNLHGTYENDLTENALKTMSKETVQRLMKGKAIDEDPARDGMHYVDGRHFGMIDGMLMTDWLRYSNRFGKAAEHFEQQLDWVLNCLQGAYEREQKSKFNND
tara:strand:- start:82 stop:399 length:318 start_codon:yes stop_codon:yes gene_type:complete